MLTELFCELLKTKRTPVWLIAGAAPLSVAIVAVLMAVKQGLPAGLLSNALGLWVVLVMPMSVAAITAYLAQIEHAPRAFDHLFALPIRRSRLFLAKALVALGLLGAMNVAVIGITALLGGAVLEDSRSLSAVSEILPASIATSVSSIALCIVQLWVALRVRSFLVPIMVGVIGSFVAGAALGTVYSAVTPWGAPMAILASEGRWASAGGIAGALGGVVLLVAMVGDLHRAALNR